MFKMYKMLDKGISNTSSIRKYPLSRYLVTFMVCSYSQFIGQRGWHIFWLKIDYLYVAWLCHVYYYTDFTFESNKVTKHLSVTKRRIDKFEC